MATPDDRDAVGSRLYLVAGHHYSPLQRTQLTRWLLQYSETQRKRDFVIPPLGDVVLTIEPVRSTAVSGLAAKPIIGVEGVVASTEEVPTTVRRLESLGYRPKVIYGIEGREAFCPREGMPQHPLYVWYPKREVALREKIKLRMVNRVLPGAYVRHGPDAIDGKSSRKRR